MVSVHDSERGAALGELARFRQEFYRCLPLRADALFELTDAVWWAGILDPRGLGGWDEFTGVPAGEVRDVVERLPEAGHWKPGDPDILLVFDAGYDVTRLAFLLAGLPVELLGRVRSDRSFFFPP